MEHPTDFESIVEAYPVKLDNFEGPLDLLLFLIRKNELNVQDIPIVPITVQYLDYLALMRELDLDTAGEFLLMAATLIHIKSKMLLPRPGPGENESEEDPREALMHRLLEHQKFKTAAGLLHRPRVAARWAQGRRLRREAKSMQSLPRGDRLHDCLRCAFRHWQS